MAESPVHRTCSYCKVEQTITFDTDGMGHLIELPLKCGCERKVRPVYGGRRCLDCPSSVSGRSLRCEPCKRARNNGHSQTWKERHPERAQKLQEAQNARRAAERAGSNGDAVRARDRQPSRRAKKNAAQAKRMRDPEYRAEHYRKKKEWAEANPEKVKASQDKANGLRAAEKREHMHLYSTKYVGKDCIPPKCRKCGSTIPYDGVGRPRLDCETCRNPPMEATA